MLSAITTLSVALKLLPLYERYEIFNILVIIITHAIITPEQIIAFIISFNFILNEYTL